MSLKSTAFTIFLHRSCPEPVEWTIIPLRTLTRWESISGASLEKEVRMIFAIAGLTLGIPVSWILNRSGKKSLQGSTIMIIFLTLVATMAIGGAIGLAAPNKVINDRQALIPYDKEGRIFTKSFEDISWYQTKDGEGYIPTRDIFPDQRDEGYVQLVGSTCPDDPISWSIWALCVREVTKTLHVPADSNLELAELPDS